LPASVLVLACLKHVSPLPTDVWRLPIFGKDAPVEQTPKSAQDEGSSKTMTIDPRLNRIVAAQPYPLLFATISGAHLYGFPSPDSDFDLRGVHVLPLEMVVGLE